MTVRVADSQHMRLLCSICEQVIEYEPSDVQTVHKQIPLAAKGCTQEWKVITCACGSLIGLDGK